MNDRTNKPRGLGRGLSALMSDVAMANETQEQSPKAPDLYVAVERVQPNPNQPRRSFNEDALSELASSIKEKGIIQPLIVRVMPSDPSKFEIVAGERRWRAAQRAQLHEVPVIVREFTDTEVLEVAIIENIQRADLNAIDEAAGYKQLMDRFSHTQDNLASALGKSRSHIANMLRLLNLPEEVQGYVVEGKLSAGHARTLVGNDDAIPLARKIIAEGLSVRDAEKLAKGAKPSVVKEKKPRSSEKDPDTIQLEQELSATLRIKVSIDHDSGKESGRISLQYQDLDQLDEILRLLSVG
ncbi:ParB/RepB/Spo0J family partition protein [Marivivens sp. LCG002]|uniref:ParB/RepB/Spo0J family partition protein n=1 Tax=Marivivens sp. LCG002 TaxID=3051171 RepID=UPI0025530D76|nr:ParB/RepB/Spo0J family partition protein [Marivivens sp. LCG002]WIV50785.1 ParB/RepB/Spo0J family partition protein [Marivivens sp. LCG002]